MKAIAYVGPLLALALISSVCGGNGDGAEPAPPDVGSEDETAPDQAGTPVVVSVSPSPSSTSTATATPELPPDGDREEQLRETILEFMEALFTGNEIPRAYVYFHEGYKAKCSLSEFTALTLLAQAFGFNLEEAEYRIETVRIEGDRTYVTGNFFIDDRPVGDTSGEDEEEYWLWDNGKWWAMTDDPKPCNVDFGTLPTPGPRVTDTPHPATAPATHT